MTDTSDQELQRDRANLALKQQRRILNAYRRSVDENDGMTSDEKVAAKGEIYLKLDVINARIEALETAPTFTPPSDEQMEKLKQAVENVAAVVAAANTAQAFIEAANNILAEYGPGVGA